MALAPVRVTGPSGSVIDMNDLKLWLKVDDNDDDMTIHRLATAAVAAFDGIRSPMRRCLLTQTWRQDFDGWGTYGYLRLPFFGVSAVVVKYFDSDNAEQTVSSSLYELLEDECGAYVNFLSDFSEPSVYTRSDAVRVTMTVGYGTAADIPSEIINAIWRMVAMAYEKRDAQVEAADYVPSPYRDYHV